MSKISNGSRWSDSTGKKFVVIGTMLVDGKEWVYYRLEQPVNHMPAEFSCYTESFLSRFTALPE